MPDRPGLRDVAFVMGLMMIVPASSGAAPQASTLDRVVEGLNRDLARMQDMTGDFVQIVESAVNQPSRHEGHVYLARGGRSRWEYDVPETEIHIYDGQTWREYKPAQNLLRIREIPPEAYDSMPLMSVLGRRNLIDEFGEFQLLDPAGAVVAGTHVVRAYPKRETDVRHIVIEAGETGSGAFVIRRLFIQFRNQSNDLIFSDVLTNTGLGDALWEFTPPPGTEIVDLTN